MSKPIVKEQGIYLKLTWNEEGIIISVSRIHAHKDGRVTGEILITTTASEKNHIHQAQLNFTASNTRRQLAKQLSEKYPKIKWDDMMEQLVKITLDWQRKGEPVTELSSDEPAPPLEYLLYPLIPKDAPTQLWGDGGTGKSLISLLCGICVSKAWYDNPFGFLVPELPTTTLILDWETDQNTTHRRLNYLSKGLGLERAFINYRFCDKPLSDDLEQIMETIINLDAKFLILDSIGKACAGDLNSSEIATRFSSALRQLRTTVLLINHTSKNSEGGKTAFGSVFFRNYARSEWNIKKQQEDDEDVIDIGLFHTKSNDSKLFKPLGFHIEFQNDRTIITPRNASDIRAILGEETIEQLIRKELKQPMTYKEIAKCIGRDSNVTRQTLNRMEKKNIVAHSEGKWGLIYNNIL